MDNQNNNRNVNSNSTSVAIIGTIPQGVVLISTNVFTGKITVLGEKRKSDGTIAREARSGLYLKLPWHKDYKIISTQSQPLLTPSSSTLSSDNIRITYDTDYMFRVVDPVAYERAFIATANNSTVARDVIKDIGKRLDQIVADYVKEQDSEDLYRMTSENLLSKIGDAEKAVLRNDYGIEVTKMLLTEIKLPREITEQAEIAKRDDIKRENDLKNARAEKAIKEMQAEADATQIIKTGEAMASKIKSWRDSGLSSEQVAYSLVQETLVNGANPNTIIMAGNQLGNSLNSQSFDMAAMLAAFSSVMQHLGQNNNNTVSPAQNQEHVNIPAQPIAPEPASAPAATPANSDIVPKEAVDALKQAGFIDKDAAYGNVVWSGLSTSTYDYLVSQGFNPPINNQNNPNFHI